jgi:hypothetical protein
LETPIETQEVITVQVTVVRNTSGVTLGLDSGALDQLNIAPGTPLVASATGESLIIISQDPARRAAIAASIAEMDEQYGEVFQRPPEEEWSRLS